MVVVVNTEKGTCTITPIYRWIVKKTTKGKKDEQSEVDDIKIAKNGNMRFLLDGKEVINAQMQNPNEENLSFIQKALTNDRS